jgi:CubicO group peptidase (beta-lactamase class C family)
VPVQVSDDEVSFVLAGGQEGEFRGTLDAARDRITGHWIQPARVESGLRFASPVTLIRSGAERWLGDVVPAEDRLTFYLKVYQREDGSIGAFLRNPERNLGWMRYRVTSIEREGDSVRLLASGESGERAPVVEGRYRAEPETLTFHLDYGGSFDFVRVPPEAPSDFYPRGRPGVVYRYAVPPRLDDGWPTASLEEVGISRQHIEAFVQRIIDTPIEAPDAQEDHGILIARDGKLVLEEYFHGENRERPHDTRSASKSVASDLFGAAMHAGFPLGVSLSVYDVMSGGHADGMEPRRRALEVEHLLTMSSGFDCDDNDPESPGYEDRMWEQQSHPDFYAWTLALDMVREPGEAAVYCSANPNLVGGFIARATGRYLPALFHELLASPLEIRRYYLPISPTGDYTMTGGARFLPRDFMKLAQLHLDGGTWNGHRVFTEEWSREATTPRYAMPAYQLHYGYLWWIVDYPYRGGTVRAYFASGNGGQIAMAVPDLRLALAFYGGNYNAAGGRRATREYVPDFILPSLDE